MRKLISVLLLLAMLASLFAGLTLTAGAEMPKNTATRHELCTGLSDAALAYYTGDNTFEALSQLSGTYTSDSTQAIDSELFVALHNLIQPTTRVSYSSLTGYWRSTDSAAGATDAILFYSDVESGSYNREHVWPKSHGDFYESGAGADLHHLRPTNSGINSTRGNLIFGNVREMFSSCSTAQYGGRTVLYYGSGYVEVNDDIKGDVARILLYLYTAYNDANNYNPNLFTSVSGKNTNDGRKVIEDLDTLLEWMQIDPVDTWEMARNDCVQAVQGNRNVYIDYPEFAWLLFGRDVPEDYLTPSGNGGSATTYTITAESNNSSYGTVTLSGNAITAVPAENCYIVDYTVTEGEATVIRRGDVFYVRAASDCTVCINFAAKTAVTVTLSNNGFTSTKAGYAGDEMTLTAPTAPEGYRFLGWVENTVDNSPDKPADIYTDTYTPNGSCTLYALYSYTQSGGSGPSDTFTKITEQKELTDGDRYVLVSSVTGRALSQNVASNWAKPGGTYSGDSIETPAATDVWTISGGVISCDSGSLTSTSAKSISLGSGTACTFEVNNSVWTIKISGNILSFNSTGWRPYSGGYGSDKTFFIYKAGSGTTCYTTTLGAPCEHSFTPQVTAPTCLEGGYTTYTCALCGYSYTANETAALGHNYGTAASNHNGTHTATCARCGDQITENCTFTSVTSGLTTTYTCTVCSHNYQTTLGTYTVTFSVPAGVPAISAETVTEEMAMTLPTAVDIDGYTFAGWTTAAIDPESTAKPTVLTGSFMPDSDITLYALYTRTEAGGSAEPALTKLVTGDTLADGDKLVIVAHDTTVALYAQTQNSSYVAKYTFYGDIDTVLTDSRNYLTATASVNGFKLYGENSGYLHNSSGNYLAMSATGTTEWTLKDLGDGTFNLVNTGGKKLSYRSDLAADNQLWRMGGSSGTSGQTVLDLYRVTEGAASTTYYTTNPTGAVTPHVHDYDSTGVCSCGDRLIEITSASLRLDEDIDVIYSAIIPDGATASMTFTMNGTSVTVEDNGTPEFVFAGVNPQCMGDNISAILTVTCGDDTYTCEKAEYSVRTYCVNKLADDGISAELRTLLSDVLAYGAAAQTYTGYKTDALVTGGNDIANPTYSTYTGSSGLAAAFEGTAVESPCWIGAGLCLTNNVEMVFRFYAETTGDLRIRISVNGETKTFTSTDFTAVSGNIYEVRLPGIKATDFGETVSARFYKLNTQTGNTVSYSVNTYICNMQNCGNANLEALVKALYNYGASAKAYAE